MNTSDDDLWATPRAQHSPQQPLPPQPYYVPDPGGGPPSPYAQPTTSRRDWMGIVSLVCGLVGFGLIGIVFGHLALRANARGLATNRGLSLAGTIVSYVTTVFGTLALVSIIAFLSTNDEFNEGFQESWNDGLAEEGFGLDEANAYLELWVDQDPAVGECLDHATSLMDDVRVVGCDHSHIAEVYATAPVPHIAQGENYDSTGAQDRVLDMCHQEFEAYVGEPTWSSEFGIWYFIASDDLLVDEDDAYICVASLDFEPTTKIAQGAGR